MCAAMCTTKQFSLHSTSPSCCTSPPSPLSPSSKAASSFVAQSWHHNRQHNRNHHNHDYFNKRNYVHDQYFEQGLDHHHNCLHEHWTSPKVLGTLQPSRLVTFGRMTVLEVWRPLGLNASELSNILQSMILNDLNFSQA